LDRQSMSASTDSTAWKYETWDRLESSLGMTTAAAGVSHDLVLGRSSYLHSSVAAAFAGMDLDQGRIDDDLVIRDDLSVDAGNGRLIIGSYLHNRLGPRHTNRTGFVVQRLFYDLDLGVALDSATTLTPIVAGSGSSTLLQGYSQSRFDQIGRA